MTERAFQAALIRKLKKQHPGVVILKNDSDYLQGVPDLLLLFGERWAMLEVKADESSPMQPNQRYWVHHFNSMAFAAFIYPQNEEEVLRALQETFGA